MSVSTSSAWAGPTVTEGCFECSNGGGGTCDPTEHKDSDGASIYQSPNAQHNGCSDNSCDSEHYYYAIGSADPLIRRSVDAKEARALVARVLRAAHDGDVAELADLSRNDTRVRLNLERGAVQVDLGGNVVAHSALPQQLVAKVLAHH